MIDFVFASDRTTYPDSTTANNISKNWNNEQGVFNKQKRIKKIKKNTKKQAEKEIQKNENRSKEEKKGEVLPLYKREEIIQLRYNRGLEKSTIARKLQLTNTKVYQVLEEYEQDKKEDPDGIEAKRQAIQESFIKRAWKIIDEADKLTLEKLQAGKANAGQANTIAAIKLDKILNLQGKSVEKKTKEMSGEVTHKIEMDKQMFKDFAKVIGRVAYRTRKADGSAKG